MGRADISTAVSATIPKALKVQAGTPFDIHVMYYVKTRI